MSTIAAESWQDLLPVPIRDQQVFVNEYFARRPERMWGELALIHGQYRQNEAALIGVITADLLTTALMEVPSGVYRSREYDSTPAEPISIDWAGIKDGAFIERNGQLMQRNGSGLEPVQVSAKQAQRIRMLIELRAALRETFRTQLHGEPEQTVTAARVRLNRKYDTFVGCFGPLSAKENRRAFRGDPDLPLLLSLEEYDPDANRATKTAVFHHRTIEARKPVEYVEAASEALLVSLNETGGITWSRMEEVTGRSREDLEQELDTLVYLNPNGGRHETTDRYLSGNVRLKLAEAEAALQLDPRFGRNVEALRSVLPKDLAPGEIAASLGAPWIPASDLQAFTGELLDTAPEGVVIGHAEAIATWTVSPDDRVKGLVSNTTSYGTARYRATALLEDCLNGRMTTAWDEHEDGSRTVNQSETLAARERQQELQDRFAEWIWSDQDRAARLARIYNERYNNLRLRSYDGSHLTFPGMVKVHLRDGDLARHQKDAAWRILQSGTCLLGHAVGAGKTWTMVAAIMELKRLGLATKPLITVPNHLVEQWGAEFLRLYPQAQILVAGKEHFANGNRQRVMARIATGSFDAVIVSHRSLELLPLSAEFVAAFIDKQIDEIDALSQQAEQDGEDRRLVKELEKAKRRLRARLEKQANRDRKDDTITFEELGIDYLLVDEADLFKNLGYVSKKTRVAGLPNADSYRAFDMYLKTRYLRERQRGRGVVFATATPIANTIAEMYTMLRYLGPELLQAQGTDHFDSWAANFGREVTSLELAPDGSGYRMHTRFAQFVNLPELLQIFRTVADVQTAEMLQLPRPSLAGGKPVTLAAPASDELKAYVQTLVARAERIRDPLERVDPRDDNMLKITSDGRKAALDMRLVDSTVLPGPESKIGQVASNLYRIWQETQKERFTQIVFIDLSTPDPHRWNAYAEIKSLLIGRGVPAEEIAFIHDAESDAAKKQLFDAVNAGRVRIVFGSTEKLGAGTNAQRRLLALHDVDAPWRPRDLEQRSGRILRPGNQNPEVWIYRYVTEGSFDGYMWQTLEGKARFITQVMSGDITVRTADDLETAALTYAEIKAIASGNPAVVEKVKVDAELRRLDQLRTIHERNRVQIQWSIGSLRSRFAQAAAHIQALEADLSTLAAYPKDQFLMSVGNREFRGKEARGDAATVLTAVALSWRDDPVPGLRGHYRGFEIWSKGKTKLSAQLDNDLPSLYLQGQAQYPAKLNPETPLGTLLSIEQTLHYVDRHLENEKAEQQRLSKQLADFEVQLARSFEHEEAFRALLERQAELASALELHEADRQAQTTTDCETVESENPNEVA